MTLLNLLHHLSRIPRGLPLAMASLIVLGQTLSATDYFLTIGGGYNPSGNQASLEANVVFFQTMLAEKHRGVRQHDIFFADGDDRRPDLQVLVPKTARPVRPATEILAALHRRQGGDQIEYRNHRVPGIAGPLDPALIRSRMQSIAKSARPGDRLFIYVTSHGSEGTPADVYNTTIDCWNDKKFTAREFTQWLQDMPTEIPVLMVMAQCYCGGFSHTIFNDVNSTKGLASQVRAGFFAQQHDLPAAGCRPDIENDDEFSSYFWGAIAGRRRTGDPVEGSDLDGDGAVSFAEAYAYAVVASRTIDIPLRASDALLRTYSRLAEKPGLNSPKDGPPDSAPPDDSQTKSLTGLAGSLQSLLDTSRPVTARIVTGLSQELGFMLHEDVATVVKAYNEHRRGNRTGRGPRRRSGSGRRELLQEIAEKWPELGDARKWDQSALLREDHQAELLAEIQQLPAWKNFDERRHQREAADAEADRHELREVKFRRLINALETIVLAKNLPLIAQPQIVDRYRQMILLEESTLNPVERK